jgi:hypothetical protein
MGLRFVADIAYLFLVFCTSVIVGKVSEMLPIVIAVFKWILEIICMFSGQTLPFYLFGMVLVDKNTGEPFGFFKTFFYMLFSYPLIVLDILFLLCSRRSVTERLFGGVVVIKE